MGTDEPFKTVNNSEKSKNSLKNMALVLGCSSLIISFTCLVAIPILFIFTMAMGMGAGSSPSGDAETLSNLGIGGGVLLVISPIVAVVAGIVGLVMLIFWFIEKLKT